MIQIRENCVVCSKTIDDPEENYKARGNFCSVCSGIAGIASYDRSPQALKRRRIMLFYIRESSLVKFPGTELFIEERLWRR